MSTLLSVVVPPFKVVGSSVVVFPPNSSVSPQSKILSAPTQSPSIPCSTESNIPSLSSSKSISSFTPSLSVSIVKVSSL